MNSRERFYATVERKPVDRPACWLGDPTPEAVPALCEYYHVDNIKELKKVCGDDFYAVEIPYKSPTCSAIFAAFDWYMNGSDIDTEHRRQRDVLHSAKILKISKQLIMNGRIQHFILIQKNAAVW